MMTVLYYFFILFLLLNATESTFITHAFKCYPVSLMTTKPFVAQKHQQMRHNQQETYRVEQRKESRRCIIKLYDASSSSTTSVTSELEAFLQQEHSMFYSILLSNNDYVWKMIRDTVSNNNGGGGCTLFAPTNAAIQQLGEQKLQQLQDNRNEEVKNQIASYHVVVNDIVTPEQLYNSGGIRTIAKGENPIVPIERTKQSKNFFDTLIGGGQEDGSVTMGSNAHILNTYFLQSSNTIVHQMDALISPNILWRYMDQLRIPGSK